MGASRTTPKSIKERMGVWLADVEDPSALEEEGRVNGTNLQTEVGRSDYLMKEAYEIMQDFLVTEEDE